MPEIFGTMPDGTPVREIELTDGTVRCSVLTYGGTVRTLLVPDRDGVLRDVVLGYDSPEDYRRQRSYMGAVIGRYANRIRGAAFPLGGNTVRVSANEGENHLHGGFCGFDRKVFSVLEEAPNALVLRLVSPDGEEGFPGTLTADVTFSVSGGALRIEYAAVSDADTVCSFTSHPYFNLTRQDAGTLEGHSLQIRSARYAPVAPDHIPAGGLRDAAGTPFDFREPAPILGRVDADDPQLRISGGYDHAYELEGSGSLLPAALARSAVSGISMEVATTQPCLQFYTANFVEPDPRGKNGFAYPRRSAFCLEPQAFPDAPNQPGFPSAFLPKGIRSRAVTEYRFGTF